MAKGYSVSIDNYSQRPPESDTVTGYDRAHFEMYIALLDAANLESSWIDAYKTAFGVGPPADRLEAAKAFYESHLQRARWMTVSGFQRLL